MRIDLSAADPFTTHEVLTAVATTQLEGARVLVQRYGITNVEARGSVEGARRRGARDSNLPLGAAERHRATGRVDGRACQPHASTQWRSPTRRRSTTYSPLAGGLGRTDALRADLNRTLIASIGPVASSSLRQFGVNVGLESRPPKLGPLIAALDAALSTLTRHHLPVVVTDIDTVLAIRAPGSSCLLRRASP